jgi:hypothetical protein
VASGQRDCRLDRARTPRFDPALAERYAAFHRRAWQLVDMLIGHLMGLAGDDAAAALFVTGDHGTRPYWRLFRPNAVLREAEWLGIPAPPHATGTSRLGEWLWQR